MGFSEVVRGLVSPTPFMEGCVSLTPLDPYRGAYGGGGLKEGGNLMYLIPKCNMFLESP